MAELSRSDKTVQPQSLKCQLPDFLHTHMHTHTCTHTQLPTCFIKIHLGPGYKWPVVQVFSLRRRQTWVQVSLLAFSQLGNWTSNLTSRASRFQFHPLLAQWELKSAHILCIKPCAPAKGWVHLTEKAPSNMFTQMCITVEGGSLFLSFLICKIKVITNSLFLTFEYHKVIKRLTHIECWAVFAFNTCSENSLLVLLLQMIQKKSSGSKEDGEGGEEGKTPLTIFFQTDTFRRPSEIEEKCLPKYPPRAVILNLFHLNFRFPTFKLDIRLLSFTLWTNSNFGEWVLAREGATSKAQTLPSTPEDRWERPDVNRKWQFSDISALTGVSPDVLGAQREASVFVGLPQELIFAKVMVISSASFSSACKTQSNTTKCISPNYHIWICQKDWISIKYNSWVFCTILPTVLFQKLLNSP